MEVPMDLTPVLGGTLVRLDSMRVKQLQNLTVYRAIDKLGEMSAKAMQLRGVLTSCEKLMQQPEHSLYLLWERSEQDPNVSVLIGLFKVGKKTLFLYDADMSTFHGKVTAVLDFYVHFSRQRHGYGRQLFDFMLHSERLAPEQLALDNPSVTLLAFMTKHYELENAIWQNTNFVVFPQFFRSHIAANGTASEPDKVVKDEKVVPPEGWGRPGTPRHIGGGATETRWLDHAISGHEHKGNAMSNSVHGDISTEGTLANRANQAKQRKAHILSSKPLW